MKPNVLLAETRTPNGARMTLVEHDGSYCIRVNGQQLMHSSVAASEIELGRLGVELLANTRPTRVLIGGLGLGFTLKSVLAHTGPKVAVHVAELFPEIVAWNRTYLAKLNGGALGDPRVTVHEEDVRLGIGRAVRAPFDAIVLDIDNGTTAMVKDENHHLYSDQGIQLMARAVKPGGRITIWSACADAVLEQRLKRARLAVRGVPAPVHASARRYAYMIYVADRPVSDGGETR